MRSLPRALVLALAQLADPAILRLLGKTALITLALFAVGGGLLYWVLDRALEDWMIANLPADYSNAVAGIVALSLGFVAAWLLFRIVALAVLQFFADEVVRAVEQRHYPAAAAHMRALPLAEDFGIALRALGRTLLANLLALPFALVLLVTGVGPAILFAAVNAVLLGRELQDMVWLRHRTAAQEAAPIGWLARFALGAIMVGLLALPFLNLLAPIVGAATATHLVHTGRRKRHHA